MESQREEGFEDEKSSEQLQYQEDLRMCRAALAVNEFNKDEFVFYEIHDA